MSDTGWSRIPITFDNILFYSLFTFLYFFLEDYSQHINIKSNLKRVSTFLLIFHVVFSDSSYSLLLQWLLLPKTFFSCLYFSLIPFSSHNLFFISSLLGEYFLEWMEVFTFFVLGFRKAIHKSYFRLARELFAVFKSQFIGNFLRFEELFSSAKRRMACTRLGNPKICFTLHSTRQHFSILGQRNRFFSARKNTLAGFSLLQVQKLVTHFVETQIHATLECSNFKPWGEDEKRCTT